MSCSFLLEQECERLRLENEQLQKKIDGHERAIQMLLEYIERHEIYD